MVFWSILPFWANLIKYSTLTTFTILSKPDVRLSVWSNLPFRAKVVKNETLIKFTALSKLDFWYEFAWSSKLNTNLKFAIVFAITTNAEKIWKLYSSLSMRANVKKNVAFTSIAIKQMWGKFKSLLLGNMSKFEQMWHLLCLLNICHRGKIYFFRPVI